MDRLQNVLQSIDAFNQKDPNTESVSGIRQPREWVYAQRLSGWVAKLDPKASEALQIAARGQHIGRWAIPRGAYPMDRGGYLRWRETLKRFHADTVVGFMQTAGYSITEQERVRSIILKKNLRNDPEVQTLEDALCLVFLEHQFMELLEKTPRDKMIDIVRKTWTKMGALGQKEALRLTMPPAQHQLLREALSP